MNYQRIKMRARGAKCRVEDFLALAPANDPFYVGRPSQESAARWFTDLWQRFYPDGDGVHLRRLHYRIVSQVDPITRPDGSPYHNDKLSWGYLVNAGKYARYLGMVDAAKFSDKRNSDPIIGTDYSIDPTPRAYLYDGDEYNEHSNEWMDYADLLPTLPSIPELGTLDDLPPFPCFVAHGLTTPRQYHVEVWAEKTTMNDILEPLCKLRGMNLITGMGELSITAVVDYLRRVEVAGVPSRILYISDYDPAGHQMPVSIARKIEFFQRNESAWADFDIKLRPLVLTAEQVAAHKLPRIPVKAHDKRKKGWQANHGAGAVELDALEAIHPGTLIDIVNDAADQYYDVTLVHRSYQVLRDMRRYMSQLTASTLGAAIVEDMERIEVEYDELRNDFEDIRNQFDTAVQRIQPLVDAYQERLDRLNTTAKSVRDDAVIRLHNVTPDITPYQLPASTVPHEPARLYESGRSYEQQIDVYKVYKSGGK